MKKLTFFPTLFFLLFACCLQAQTTVTRDANFQTVNQSIFDGGPATVLADTFYMLKDNGQEAAFFQDLSFGGIAHDETFGDYGLEIAAKFGIDFDMYARFMINSGSANVDYPAKIKFSIPNANSFGCGEEVSVNTSVTLDPNYKLEISDPGAEFAVGSEFNAGLYFGGQACFVDCAEFPDAIDIGNPSFKNANASNYKSLLNPGFYDFLRVSTSDGIQFPWDLNGSIPNPGAPALTLPLNTATIPGFENLTHISGTIDNPVQELDGTDMLMGNAIADKSNYHFMHMEFDPLQFQQYFTGIPLTFSGSLGPVDVDMDILSVPLIMDGYMKSDFKFDPILNATLDFGQVISWKEMDGATVVQSGTSDKAENFTIGHQLKFTYPDNQQLSFTPTINISSQFKTKMDLNFNASVGIRILSGSIFMDGVFDEHFNAVNQTIPIGAFSIPVFEKTFPMGGFTNITQAPVVMTPDMAPPVVTTKNITVPIPALGGPATIAPIDVINSAVDVNGGTVRYLSVSPSSFDCLNLGANNVTVMLDDNRCNQVSKQATVTIVDITKPTIVCKPVTVFLDQAGNASIVKQDVFLSGFDNCGNVNLQSVAPSAFNCSNWGTNTAVLTVDDGHGNSNTCTATITVVDNIAPSVVCKDKTVFLNAAGNAAIVTADVFLSGTDNCGAVNQQSVIPSSFNCGNLGANTVVLTVNDGHGNTTTCNAIVTVVDNIPPAPLCKNATINLDANGNAGLTSAQVFLSATDNCGTINLQSVAPATFNCANYGANTVVLTVNDGHGNTASCTATVTVADNIAPTVVCKTYANVFLTANGTAVLPPAELFQSGADNCGTVNLVSVSPGNFDCSSTTSLHTVTLLVNDGHGNTANCSAPVKVLDYVPPTMLCRNLTIALDANGNAGITPAQVDNGSHDACGMQSFSLSQTSFNCSQVGANTVTLVGEDIHGNKAPCTATVTVQDNILPVAICKNATVELGVAGTVTVAPASLNNGSTDNCSLALTLTPNTFTCANVGANPVVFKVTDAGGHTASCSAVVTVQDKMAPTTLCKNITVLLNNEGQASITTADVNNGSSDNCAIATLSIDVTQFNCSDIPGSPKVVKLTAKDVYNNQSSCLANVTVKESIAPTAICADLSVQLNAQGKATVYGADLAADSYDNCSVWSFSPVAKIYTTANLGLNNLTIAVRDWSNNAAACVSKVTVLPYTAGGQSLSARHKEVTETSDGSELPTDDRAEAPTGIAVHDLLVYPNPTDGEATLAFALPIQQAYVLRLFDASGRLIWNRNELGLEGDNALRLHLGELAPGMYLLDFQSDDLQSRQRLMIQR